MAFRLPDERPTKLNLTVSVDKTNEVEKQLKSSKERN